MSRVSALATARDTSETFLGAAPVAAASADPAGAAALLDAPSDALADVSRRLELLSHSAAERHEQVMGALAELTAAIRSHGGADLSPATPARRWRRSRTSCRCTPS